MQTDPPSDADFYDEEMCDSQSAQSQCSQTSQQCSQPLQSQPEEGTREPNEPTKEPETPKDTDMETADVEMPDSPPPSQSSTSSLCDFLLSETAPHQPGAWTSTQIRVQDSVTDAARYPLCMERFFHPNGLMQPRDQDLSSLDANGKTWVMERQPLSLPIDGNTWSFVDECHAGITSELLKVLYFFDIVNGMSKHFVWNGFVVATSDISGCNQSTFLQPSLAPNNKDINGVMLSQYVEPDGSISYKGSNNGVDTGKLLASSELSAAGTVYTSMDLFRISVGFTAAVFESSRVKRKSGRQREQDDSDDEDESRQAIFGVVTVTALRNVDTLKLVMVF